MAYEIRDLSDDERRLLDAVAADPKSDAPRLAYADYIEPVDPERAEYIRLDCAFETETPRGTYRQKTGWLAELEGWFRARMYERGFKGLYSSRGFLTSATVGSSVLRERADALFDRNPLLGELTVEPTNADLPAIAALPHLRQVRQLKIEPERQLVVWRREWEPKAGHELDDETLAAFLESPHLVSVTVLALTSACVGPASARAIARSEALGGVRSLYIAQDQRMTAESAAQLAARPRRDALGSLTVAHCAVGPDGCAAIAASELVAGVTYLSLEANRIGDAGARALGASASLSECRSLHLMKNGIGDDGAAGLALSSGLAKLEELDLTENLVGDAGARAFADAPHLDRLRILNMNQNSIAETGAEALASTRRLPALASLGLSHNALYTDEIEQWTDWDGTPVGSGPVRVDHPELVRRYGRRFKIL